MKWRDESKFEEFRYRTTYLLFVKRPNNQLLFLKGTEQEKKLMLFLKIFYFCIIFFTRKGIEEEMEGR